ncbi:SGNH/GDSL hydrolase family protein [Niallia sp. Krafla_26]|uniref:SGNH/GDSL hydrolase family protein n=1 Tax=Niallia sp. Krafla_26 TaxID=3064703 RepID=UPI003D178B06
MKNTSVRITTIIAVLLSFLWIFGFAWSIQDSTFGHGEDVEEKATSQSEENGTRELTVLALGDSLTRGTGDETGQGYVGMVTTQLKEELDNVFVHNLGISGQTSTQLLKQLSEKNIIRQVEQADVILMTIGGNDLFQGGETLSNLDFENIKSLQEQYLKNLEQIFTTIRNHNEQGTVFILGLYNPFIELDPTNVTNEVVRGWNYSTETLTGKFEKVVFVPTFDLFQLSVNDYLYTDYFHPNQAGYELIGERLAPLITWEKEVESDE